MTPVGPKDNGKALEMPVKWQDKPDGHWRRDGLAKLLMQQQLARPAGLEPATSWFVAVNLFVDPAQLTARETSELPATWTQSWTQDQPAASELNAIDVSRPVFRKAPPDRKLNEDPTTTYRAWVFAAERTFSNPAELGSRAALVSHSETASGRALRECGTRHP